MRLGGTKGISAEARQTTQRNMNVIYRKDVKNTKKSKGRSLTIQAP